MVCGRSASQLDDFEKLPVLLRLEAASRSGRSQRSRETESRPKTKRRKTIMATTKQLDNAGEEARKLYSTIVSSGKDYNKKRKDRTEELRKALDPVWSALAKGHAVNGCSTKLEWCKWANPEAKNPERWFYNVMGDKLKSVQPNYRLFDAKLGTLHANTKSAYIGMELLGSGVKGGFTITVEPQEVPLKKDMRCPACLWGAPVDVEKGTYGKHSDLTGHVGKGDCPLSGKRVGENLTGSAVVRALYHKTKRTLSSMHLWNDGMKKAFDEQATPISEKESKTLKTRVDTHMEEEMARAKAKAAAA
jgi:hypothetical protein